MRAEQERAFSLRDFFRAGHLPTLVASLLHFETSFMIWVLMGGLAVLIAADLGLSSAEKGFLVGVPLLGGALSRVPIGLLSDRYGARCVGTITMLALLIPLGLAWLVADDFPRLILVGLLLGVAGSSFAVALPLAGSWYPPRFQGTAMGIAAAGNSGTVLASLFAPRLAESVGWHGVFGLAMIPAILVALVFMTVARSAPTRGGAERSRTAWALLREGDLWWLSLLYSVTFGGYAGFSTFLAIFFKDQYDLSAVAAGGLVAVCAIAGSLARPFGGAWSDRFGGMRVLTAVFALAPLTLLAPMVGAPLPLTVASLVVGMAWLGLGNGAVFQLVPTRFAGQTGLATGFAGAAGGLGGFLLPALMGIQREMTGSYGPGFFIFALILANMFLCVRALEVGWRFTWLSPTGTRTSPAMDA